MTPYSGKPYEQGMLGFLFGIVVGLIITLLSSIGYSFPLVFALLKSRMNLKFYYIVSILAGLLAPLCLYFFAVDLGRNGLVVWLMGPIIISFVVGSILMWLATSMRRHHK